MATLIRYLSLPLFILIAGCAGMPGAQKQWMPTLRHELSYLGAENWVVIAEAAFPIQSRPGLRVIQLNADIPEVVDGVERVIEEKYHVKPRLYVTAEVASVPYDYAPGIKNYHQQLEKALHGRETVRLDHKMLMRMLNDASKTYRVLVIKTHTALPYTSVFMELGSGYWDAESESALRDAMENKKKP